MLGPIPTLPAGAEPVHVEELVRRVTEVGRAMLFADNDPRLTSTGETDDSLPLLLSKPSLRALMVTMGVHGFVIVRRSSEGKEDSPLLEPSSGQVVGLHFPPPSIESRSIVSVSGAGDCLASGFLAGVVAGMPVTGCAALANQAAARSLQSVATVPHTIDNITSGNIRGGIGFRVQTLI